ncbi:MAG: hypothetical protein QOK14_48, partial [Frankiaceae bacterium]|nr:hypothetical protein [Frankiaceae bacterium]
TRWPSPSAAGDAAALRTRGLASAGVAFSGYAETSGSLPLPDADILASTAHLLGDTNHLRIWSVDAGRSRVDELRTGGELDSYVDGDTVTRWDSDARTVTVVSGWRTARLPQPPDITPPELGRRLLALAGDVADITAGVVLAAGGDRVAGRATTALTMTPADGRSLIREARVWLDNATGLPLRATVTARDGSMAVESAMREVRFTAPSESVLTFVAPPDAAYEEVSLADVQELIDRRGGGARALPATAAGLPVRAGSTLGLASYGNAFTLVWVVPLSGADLSHLRRRYLRRGQEPQTMSYGDQLLITTPLLTGALVDTPRGAFAIAGTVTVDVVQAVAADLARGAA